MTDYFNIHQNMLKWHYALAKSDMKRKQVHRFIWWPSRTISWYCTFCSLSLSLQMLTLLLSLPSIYSNHITLKLSTSHLQTLALSTLNSQPLTISTINSHPLYFKHNVTSYGFMWTSQNIKNKRVKGWELRSDMRPWGARWLGPRGQDSERCGGEWSRVVNREVKSCRESSQEF